MNYVCLNGKIFEAGTPVFLADNRGFRYGDGLFETMKMVKRNILFEDYHFDRLFSGLSLLQYKIPKLFNPGTLTTKIVLLCKKNGCAELSRIRLSVYRGNGGLYEGGDSLDYLIECWPLDINVNELNANGLIIDIYPGAQKSCDLFCNLKSSNFLPYVMAALHARRNKLNDCLVVNTGGNIADATIANLFFIKDENIFTPPLSEGCVNGVMRRYLLEKMKSIYNVSEKKVSVSDIENADEVFLTNAISGIRWVKQFRDSTFTNNMTAKIYNQFLAPIFRN